jgi:6-phosphogluconolactonase
MSIYIPFDDEHILSEVVEKIASFIRFTVNCRDSCHMVFPGGRSPYLIFELLQKEDLPWSKLHLYPSDERCVPVNSEARNDRLIDKFLIETSILPKENLHRISAELGADKGAYFYNKTLADVPRFDLALLGIGCDGHTASLFPGDHWDEKKSALPVHNSPKFPSERVTISLSRLRDARERWVIVSGTEKKSIMERIQRGEIFPVTRVLPTVFFVDKKVMA